MTLPQMRRRYPNKEPVAFILNSSLTRVALIIYTNVFRIALDIPSLIFMNHVCIY